MRNAGLVELQAGIGGRNINNLRYADDTTVIAESEKEIKCLLLKVKESERASLRLNIKKKPTKIMTSNSITSWKIGGEKVEVVTDFLFLGSKITLDGDCPHEIGRRLLLGRKTMKNLNSVLKSRDITLLT